MSPGLRPQKVDHDQGAGRPIPKVADRPIPKGRRTADPESTAINSGAVDVHTIAVAESDSQNR